MAGGPDMVSYRARQKLHPNWPRLAREWECRLVRLPRKFTTKGGQEFDEGTILFVRSLSGSKLNLEGCRNAQRSRYIRGVRMEGVELLPMEAL